MPAADAPDLGRLLQGAPAGRVAVRLGAAADATRMIAPAVAVFDAHGPVAVDTPQEVGALDGPVIDLPDQLALPPLVNAHAHLDLTDIRDLPFDGSFARWVGAVRVRRAKAPEAVAAVVREGVMRSVAGGTGFIGDIAGDFGLLALDALRASAREFGLQGVSYVEVFGIGAASHRGVDFLGRLRGRTDEIRDGIRLGVSPHAPYSCDDAVYAAAAQLGLPTSTHLSETTDEALFTREGSGPFADLLKSFGTWTPDLRGWARSPVERVQPLLRGTGAQLVHLNYLSDADLALLVRDAGADRACVPVYCPRASEYFRHPEPGQAPHRYRELLAAGVPVALGTDSAIVLGDAPTISVLDDMRLLWRRDGTDPMQLLAMATVHGARALGLPTDLVTLPTTSRRGAKRLLLLTSGHAGPPLTSLAHGLDCSAACRWLG